MITLKNLFDKLDKEGALQLQALLMRWLSDKLDQYKNIDFWKLNLRELPMDFRQKLTQLPMTQETYAALQRAIDPMSYITMLEAKSVEDGKRLAKLEQTVLALTQLLQANKSSEVSSTSTNKPEHKPKSPGSFF